MYSKHNILADALDAEWGLGIQMDGTHSVFNLENKLAEYYQKKYCILLNNATIGLHAAAISISCKPYHFIAPGFGWSGTIAGFLHLGHAVSFANIDDRFCLDPRKIESLITPSTKAIISIDSGGNACDSKSIATIAKQYGLIYISDSAQSLGAERDGLPAGAFSDVVVLSFTKGKTINTGEMGAVLTNNEKIYSEIVRLTQHPHRQKKVFGNSNWFPFSPFNGRVHPISAIIANKQFEKIRQIVSTRQKTAIDILSSLEVVLPDFPLSESTFFEYYCGSNINSSLLDKCSSEDNWFVEPSLSDMNLVDLTRKYYSKQIVNHNAPTLNQRLNKMIKVQFNW